MPLFEYRCRTCDTTFEALVSASAPAEPPCPGCGGTQLERLLSAFAVGTSHRQAPAEAGPCGSCGAAQRGMCGVD